MKKVFITGEAGVIPKHLTEILNLGCDFKVIEYPASMKTHNSFSIRENELDFTSKHFEDCIRMETPDIIIHSGAYVGTDFCDNSQQAACVSNVFGTKNVVDICNKYGIDLIYLSTTAIFDPKHYGPMMPITEFTKINPQTYYGITKYAGELTVVNECKTKWLVVRPVFGFSEFPHDLHSALTKYIYASINNVDLTILLNKGTDKSYTHARNIAKTICNLMKDGKWLDTFNIGKNFTQSMNWNEMITIFELFDIGKGKKINFIPEKDYLHYHNINNAKVSDYFTDDSFVKDIGNVVDSVKQNKHIKPYWI